jgi:hypothetical protein
MAPAALLQTEPAQAHVSDAAAPVDEAAPAETTVRRELRARRQPKGFLQRTVIPYPTHFWPKSWKHAWRRRRQAIDARKAGAAE